MAIEERIIYKDVPDFKVCSTCGKEKPRKNYYNHNTTKDGLTPACKNCDNARRARQKRTPS